VGSSSPMNASTIDEVRDDLEQALVLIREARFSDLAAHAEKMNRHIAALGQLKAGIESAETPVNSGEVETACQQLKERLHLVSEVLCHGSMVECGLREVELAVTTSYSKNGYSASSSRSRLSAEA